MRVDNAYENVAWVANVVCPETGFIDFGRRAPMLVRCFGGVWIHHGDEAVYFQE